MIAAVTLPWVAVIGMDILSEHEAAEAEALRSVQQRSRLLAQEIDDTLQRSRQLLDFLASRPEIAQADQAGCQSLLGGLLRIDPLLANAAFADARGQVLCASIRNERLPSSVIHAEEFEAARASKPVVLGAPRPGPVAGRPVLPLLRGVDGPGGRTIGVLVLTLDLQAWSESWHRHAMTEGSTLALQNSAGIIVARYPDPGRWIGHDAAERLQAFRRMAPEGVGLGVGVDGVRRFFATTALPGWGCTVVAGIPEQAVLAPARAEALRAGVALLLLTLLVWWLAWRLSRRLVAPLQHLAVTARAVAEGRREARADEDLPGEFSTVASEFNRMLDSRDRTQAKLAESERRFREMLDTVELFAVAADVDGRITYCNDFFLQRTGWRLDELTGADFGERCVPPERRGERDEWRQALRDGRLQAHTEAAILTCQGERRLVRWSSTMLRDERGVIVGRASIGEDVTDQRRAEAQVLRLSGFLAALSRTQRAIIHRAPRHELLREACDACVDAGQAHVASAWLLSSTGLVAEAWAGPAEALFGPMPARLDVDAPGFADSPTGHALRIGLPGISNDLADDARAGDWRESAQAAGI
ncbi:MAG TPA: cache domain-containing protein, partial [Ideonella sp.]|nr:cache domain-containing protein [Ideonella sp.]